MFVHEYLFCLNTFENGLNPFKNKRLNESITCRSINDDLNKKWFGYKCKQSQYTHEEMKNLVITQLTPYWTYSNGTKPGLLHVNHSLRGTNC